MDARLPWLLWHMLPFDYFEWGQPRRAEAVDVVGEWLEYDHDDERLEASVAIYLRARVGKPLTTPDGIEVRVVEQAGELLVELGEDRATVHDMMLAARHLMAADDPPSPPASCFSTTNVADDPPAFLRRHQPVVSTNPAPVSTWRPAPVKPPVPAPRPKAAPRTQQLSLF